MVQRRIEGAAQSLYRDLGRLLLQRVHQRVLGRRTDNFTFGRVQHARPTFAARPLPCTLLRHINVDWRASSTAATTSPGPGASLGRGGCRANALDRLGQVERLNVGEFVAELGEGAHLVARVRVHLAGADHLQHLAQVLDHLLEGLRRAEVEQDAALGGLTGELIYFCFL